jgi:acyl transferase domain-containing protein
MVISLIGRAEGFAATFMKRLDKAIVDNDHVYSIITGSSINSNGRGISLTLPDGDMQEGVIRHAYSLAKRQPSDSFFVELHVTGTSMGDPIEVNTAGKIFSVGRDSDNFLRSATPHLPQMTLFRRHVLLIGWAV